MNKTGCHCGSVQVYNGKSGRLAAMVCFLSAVYVEVIDLEWMSGRVVSGLTEGKCGNNSLGEHRTV